MEHDTITLARHATARERPEPTAMIRQRDGGAVATAQGTSADRQLSSPPARRGEMPKAEGGVRSTATERAMSLRRSIVAAAMIGAGLGLALSLVYPRNNRR